VDIQQLRDLREGTPAARLARIRTIFDAFAAARTEGPDILWKNDEGDIGRGVIEEAKSADLIVIGRPMHLDGSDALHSALFDIRRLVLVTPRKPRDATGADATLGRHILVGWKPGEPIRHAALAARPWLLRADRISVVWVEKPGASYEQAASDFFAQAGVGAEMTGIKPDGRSVGRQLLAEAACRGADSLLVGAFKHGAFWNAMLGGVTRDILSHAEIPVFLMR
jgi:nucleotide-binding universal stress UspA family protein